jgi:hypothetical protein
MATDNGNGRLRGWLGLALTAIVAGGGGILGAWGALGERVNAAERAAAVNSARLTVLEVQLGRMDAKLDRLLERRP